MQFVLLASLWWLTEHGEPPTQKQLAAQAGTDGMMTSQVLRRLEQAGLLDRRAHPRDTRARLLALTPAGRERLRGALADVEAADVEFFGRVRDPDALVAALAELGPQAEDRSFGG